MKMMPWKIFLLSCLIVVAYTHDYQDYQQDHHQDYQQDHHQDYHQEQQQTSDGAESHQEYHQTSERGEYHQTRDGAESHQEYHQTSERGEYHQAHQIGDVSATSPVYKPPSPLVYENTMYTVWKELEALEREVEGVAQHYRRECPPPHPEHPVPERDSYRSEEHEQSRQKRSTPCRCFGLPGKPGLQGSQGLSGLSGISPLSESDVDHLAVRMAAHLCPRFCPSQTFDQQIDAAI